MKGTRTQWLGILGGFALIGGFFVLMSYFHLFGTTIQYHDPIYVLKSTIAFSCLPLGIFVILATNGDRDGAIKLSLIIGGMLVMAFLIGSLKLGAPIQLCLLEVYFLWIMYDGLKSGEFAQAHFGMLSKKKNPYNYWFTAALGLGMILFIAQKIYIAW